MKRPAVLLAASLIVLTGLIIAYRILALGYPVFPATPGKAYLLKFEGHVRSDGGNVTLSVALPSEQSGHIISEEYFGSGSLGFNLIRKEAARYGVWSGSTGPDGEVVTYRTVILINTSPASKAQQPRLGAYPPAVTTGERETAERLMARFQGIPLNNRIRSVLQFVGDVWEEPPPEDHELAFLEDIEEKYDQSVLLLTLFRAAGIPARTVEGIRLTDGIAAKPVTWIDAWNGQRWISVDTGSVELYKDQASLLPLTVDGTPAVSLSGGTLHDIRWDMSRQTVGRWQQNYERIVRSERFLDRWSLFRVPGEFQETFRILLLVPLGALLICILRNIIGFNTFGIFMPVLMALAFRNTGLTYGLSIFAGIILIGYLARRLLDRLRLLLVPRMSALLTLVIVSFILLALLGNKAGLRQIMAVGLLPFVILVMTIERFFVVVEEHGIRNALQTSAGSAAVAVITYLIIQSDMLQLMFFIYPELLLTVGALQILVGRYTGYRFSELFRFRELRHRI